MALKNFPRDFSHTFFDEQTLCYEDLTNLKPGAWLNDNCINTYLVYLQNDKFKGRSDISFIAPSTTYWVLMAPTEDDVREAIEPMELDKKQLIFIPINNNPNFEQMAGGSHWSLAVFNRKENKYFTYDSYGNSNAQWAQRTIQRIDGLVRPTAGSNGATSKPQIVSRPTPQQQNTCDCGIFVFAISEYLADRDGDDSKLTQELKSEQVGRMRSQLLDLIYTWWQKDIQKK